MDPFGQGYLFPLTLRGLRGPIFFFSVEVLSVSRLANSMVVFFEELFACCSMFSPFFDTEFPSFFVPSPV